MPNLGNIVGTAIIGMCVVFCSLTATAWFFLGLLRAAGVCEVAP